MENRGKRYSIELDGIKLGNKETLVPESILDSVKEINILGMKIRSDDDAVKVLSVMRDPRVEIINMLFTGKDGEVLSHRAWSMGLPSVSRMNLEGGLGGIRKEMNDMGAGRVWIAHNHPGGNAEPSEEDINFTRKFGNIMGEDFAGHIVLGREKYSVIDGKGSVEKKKYENGNGKKELREKIKTYNRPEEIAEVFKNIFEKEKDITVMAVLDNRHKIVSWDYVVKDDIADLKKDMLRRGGVRVVLLSNNEERCERFNKIYRENRNSGNAVILDVIGVDKKGRKKKSYAEKEEKSWDRFERGDGDLVLDRQDWNVRKMDCYDYKEVEKWDTGGRVPIPGIEKVKAKEREKDVYMLHRVKRDGGGFKLERWKFREDFNKVSAANFLRMFDNWKNCNVNTDGIRGKKVKRR